MDQYRITKKGWLSITAILLLVVVIVFLFLKDRFGESAADTGQEAPNKTVESEFKSDMVDSLDAEIQKRDEAIKQLNEKLKEKDLKIKEMEEVMKEISCSIYFMPNRSQLPNNASEELEKIKKVAKYLKENQIVVEGNVYAPKTKENINYGLMFSIERAEQVAIALEKKGIRKESIKIIGNGGANQFYYNDSSKSQDMSRRVDIYFE